jgi:hypothetical protein
MKAYLGCRPDILNVFSQAPKSLGRFNWGFAGLEELDLRSSSPRDRQALIGFLSENIL